jgi:hypothetical protein
MSFDIQTGPNRTAWPISNRFSLAAVGDSFCIVPFRAGVFPGEMASHLSPNRSAAAAEGRTGDSSNGPGMVDLGGKRLFIKTKG